MTIPLGLRAGGVRVDPAWHSHAPWTHGVGTTNSCQQGRVAVTAATGFGRHALDIRKEIKDYPARTTSASRLAPSLWDRSRKLFYIAAIILPCVASLQRFAVAYGYQGVPRTAALHDARRVFLIFSAISVALVIHHG